MKNLETNNKSSFHFIKSFLLIFSLSFLTSCNNKMEDNNATVDPPKKVVYVANTAQEIQNPWLAFRAEPKYDGKLVYMLPDGTRLKVIGEDSTGNFVKVELIDNVGYVSKKYLSDSLIRNNDINQSTYSKLSGEYMIGTDFYTDYLTLKYLGGNKFKYKISAESCNFSGDFELVNNIGISKNATCGNIVFNFSKIINWINSQKGDPREFSINVKVSESRSNCGNCHFIGSSSENSMEIYPWGDYWRVK